MRYGMVEIFAVLMFFISFYGLITSRNVIKSIAAIGVMEISAIMFFLSFAYSTGIRPPIGGNLAQNLANVADPLPQALVITTIIIGIAVCAVSLETFISLCRKFKTADWDTIRTMSMEPMESMEPMKYMETMETSSSVDSGIASKSDPE